MKIAKLRFEKFIQFAENVPRVIKTYRVRVHNKTMANWFEIDLGSLVLILYGSTFYTLILSKGAYKKQSHAKQSHAKEFETSKKVLKTVPYKQSKTFQFFDLDLLAPTELIYALKNQTWAQVKIKNPQIEQ